MTRKDYTHRFLNQPSEKKRKIKNGDLFKNVSPEWFTILAYMSIIVGKNIQFLFDISGNQYSFGMGNITRNIDFFNEHCANIPNENILSHFISKLPEKTLFAGHLTVHKYLITCTPYLIQKFDQAFPAKDYSVVNNHSHNPQPIRFPY